MGQGAIVRRTEGTMVGGTEFVRQRAWHVGQGAIVRWTEEAMVDETVCETAGIACGTEGAMACETGGNSPLDRGGHGRGDRVCVTGGHILWG